MIANLLAEFFGRARHAVAVILVLIAAIYVSGFIIVNAYLWKFGIARIEFFRPPFIAAGLLFVLIGISATLFMLPLFTLISRLLELARKTYDSLASPAVLLVYVGLAVLAVGGIFLLELVASWFMATLLAFATGALPSPISEFRHLLDPILRLHGTSALFVLLLLHHRAKLHDYSKPIALWLVATTFLFVQTYTLLTIANDLYAKLPPSFGGGLPMRVVFLAEQGNTQLLEEMGIEFENLLEAIEGNRHSDSALLRTRKIQLIWAVSGDDSPTFIVMPCTFPDECQPIEFRKDLIRGVVYLFFEGE